MTRANGRPTQFRFRLYVAGDAQNSVQALANLTAFCRDHLAGRHEIEIVDVFVDPARALADGVLMTPTLVKLSPKPGRHVIGNLAQTQHLLHALGVSGAAA
jgi:circadian clock protein KaiB